MARRGQWQRDLGKERFWRSVLREWRGSGLGVRAFCAERCLSEASLYAWRREIARRDREQPATKRAAPAFVPVRVVGGVGGVGDAAIEVVVRTGQTLRVAAGFEPAHLRAVVAALEGPSC